MLTEEQKDHMCKTLMNKFAITSTPKGVDKQSNMAITLDKQINKKSSALGKTMEIVNENYQITLSKILQFYDAGSYI